ncbi:hypothetical protein D3C74_450050 [compost metagenome]
MLSNDPFSSQLTEPGRIAAPLLQLMENFCPLMDHLRLLRIFPVNRGINIPAVIPETDMLPSQRYTKQADHCIRQLVA